MPPKSGKSKTAIKSEINEKVREIRLRQEKWMRERDSTLKTAPPQKQPSLGSPAETGTGATVKAVRVDKNSTIHKRHQQGHKEELPDPTTEGPHTKNDGFHNWLSNRKKSDGAAADHLLDNVELRFSEEPQYIPTDDYATTDDQHRPDDLPPLSLPATGRSNVTTAPSTAAGYDQLKVEHSDSQRTLPPSQLDNLADEIVHRVKRELHLAAKENNMEGRGTDSGRPDAVSDRAARDMKNTPGIVSHHCPVCGKLMIAPRHRPLLLIPCGHTSCQTCIDMMTTYCSICSIHVQSTTPNIMLQQIINDYYKREQGSSSRSHGPGSSDLASCDRDHVTVPRSRRTPGEQTKNHLGRTYSQIPQEPPRKSATECEEEYRNLLLRCDVLREEEESICNKMAALDREKASELSQIDNITGAQDKMRDEIKEIEGRIQDMERHKQGYRDKVNDLESLRNKERRRLEMVKTTVTQLKSDISKIKGQLDAATTSW